MTRLAWLPLTACRHANGRDWWLTKNDYYDKFKMYVFSIS